MSRIPVWRSIGDTFRIVFSNLREIIFLGWLPFGAYYACSLLLYWINADGAGPGSSLVAVIAIGSLAVAIHRLVLAGEGAGGRFYYISFDKRELSYLGFIVALSLAVYAPGSVALTQGGVIGFLAAIVSCLALFWGIRIVPALVKIAVHDRLEVGEVFAATRGQFWRILFVLMVPALLPAMARAILAWSSADLWPEGNGGWLFDPRGPFAYFAAASFLFIHTMLGAAALTVISRGLSGEPSTASPRPSAG